MRPAPSPTPRTSAWPPPTSPAHPPNVRLIAALRHLRPPIGWHYLGGRPHLPRRPATHTLVLTGAITVPVSGDRPYPFLTDRQVQDWYQDRDVHLPITGSSRRSAVTINRTRPKLGATGTQKDLLTALDIPVLVIHGDTGDQERRLATISRAGRHWLPAGSELITIPGADHTFNDRRAELDALIRPWATRHLLAAAGTLARPA